MTGESRERCKSLTCIWGDPNGMLGGLALTAMALAGLGALAFVVRWRRPLAGRA